MSVPGVQTLFIHDTSVTGLEVIDLHTTVEETKHLINYVIISITVIVWSVVHIYLHFVIKVRDFAQTLVMDPRIDLAPETHPKP